MTRDTAPGKGMASRLFTVLDVVEKSRSPLLVTQIAERAGLPVATAWRMVRDLEEWGGVERGVDGRYRIATRVWAIGSSAPCVRRIQRDTSHHLRALAEAAGRTAHLSVVQGTDAYVVSVAGSGRIAPQEGDVLELGDSAAGLVFTSFGVTGDLATDRRDDCVTHRAHDGSGSSMSVGIQDPTGAVVAALTLEGSADAAWFRHRGLMLEHARRVRFSIYRDELFATG